MNNDSLNIREDITFQNKGRKHFLSQLNETKECIKIKSSKPISRNYSPNQFPIN